ncbi:hypothetical protein ACFE04_008491 [Oxalis oulophora]
MMQGFIFHQQQELEQEQEQQVNNIVEENMSNLTSASNEANSVSSGNRTDLSTYQYYDVPPPSQPLKRKRNLPGNPDPDAEVISLSPKSLLATNRFLCEICNKGFQRDQNLQLHRRGHNLPWKLKQRTNKDEPIKKKVYVCPEQNCVHHDPARALGDLTGIKKHFCRKHGEKKWKCDKCSKRYAVQSDWKAHSKTCGSKEYRCDCGTIFSRRDSFITHRAFCDALAEESARAIITQPNPLVSANMSIQVPQVQLEPTFSLKKEPQNNTSLLPPWLSAFNPPPPPPPVMAAASLGGPGPPTQQNLDQQSSSSSTIFPSLNPNNNLLLGPTTSPYMSATALLQKAAQMGSTMSCGNNSTSTHHDRLLMSSGPQQQNTTGLIGLMNSSSHNNNQLVNVSTTRGFQDMMMMNSQSGMSMFEDAFVGGDQAGGMTRDFFTL